MSRATAIITVPTGSAGAFRAAGAVVFDHDEIGPEVSTRITLADVSASLMRPSQAKGFHIWSGRRDAYLSLVTAGDAYNPNPLDTLMEEIDGVVPGDPTWASWDVGIASAATLTSSLHGQIEAGFGKAMIVNLMEKVGFSKGDVTVVIAVESTIEVPSPAPRMLSGWDATNIQRVPVDEVETPELFYKIGPHIIPLFVYQLAGLVTKRDQDVGLKVAKTGLGSEIGPRLAAENCRANGAKFWPVISIETTPGDAGVLTIRGWLFSLSDTSTENTNAMTMFTRSLQLISEGTLPLQDMQDSRRTDEVIGSFAPKEGEMGVKIEKPELVKSFLIGTPLRNLTAEAEQATRTLWRVSEATPNTIQGAIAVQRSGLLDLQDAANQAVRPLFADAADTSGPESLLLLGAVHRVAGHSIPKEDGRPEAPKLPERHDEQRPVNADELDEKVVPSSDREDVAAAAGSPEGAEDEADERIVTPLEEPAAPTATVPGSDPQDGPGNDHPEMPAIPIANLEAVLGDLRERIGERPTHAAKIGEKITDELRQACGSGGVLGYKRLIDILGRAGFSNISETSSGLILRIEGVADGLHLTAEGPDDPLHPANQAQRVVSSFKVQDAVDEAIVSAADDVLGKSGHYLAALTSALMIAGGDTGEGLVERGAGLEELLTVQLLAWLIDVKDDVGDERDFANRTLGKSHALDRAIAVIRDALSTETSAAVGADNPDGPEAAEEDHGLPAQAQSIWASDLKNGRAFLKPTPVPSTKKAAQR